MTKFNPTGKTALTYGECLGPAMKITDQADADQYFHDYAAFIQRHLKVEPRRDDMTAEQIAKTNLGYYAGYYDSETRERVERLFTCSHPIFGKITNGVPTTSKKGDIPMKKTIWKYVLVPKKGTFNILIDIPKGATVLTAREQGDDICIWAEVNPDEPFKETRIFEVFGTGHEMPIDMGIDRKYIGTASILGGGLIFHVYERLN